MNNPIPAKIPGDSEAINPPCAAPILAALGENPECRPGLLARGRLAYAEHGRMSHGGGQELFCLVRHVTWPFVGFYYGHVLRVACEAKQDGAPATVWVALLAHTSIAIDGETADEVLASAKEWLWYMGSHEPCYAQDQSDVYKECGSFEEACAALAEMARRFVLKRRAVVLETEEDDRRFDRGEWPMPGVLDMRSLDIYGFGQLTDPWENFYQSEREAQRQGEPS